MAWRGTVQIELIELLEVGRARFVAGDGKTLGLPIGAHDLVTLYMRTGASHD